MPVQFIGTVMIDEQSLFHAGHQSQDCAGLAALLNAYGLPPGAIAAIVLAMGLANAVFQVDGGAGIGITYVTGALVKVGH